MRTHAELPSFCEDLGLPVPPEHGTKRERISASYHAAEDSCLVSVAQKVLSQLLLGARSRNQIQDLLWSDVETPKFPKRLRHELSRDLSPEDLFLNSDEFLNLLTRLFVLDDDMFSELLGGTSLHTEIERHVLRNPGDWSVEELFDKLGAFDCSDHRFKLLLEGLCSMDVRPDVAEMRRFSEAVNPALRTFGLEFRESTEVEGYPVYSVGWLSCRAQTPPKNLIFASPVKPDLRFRDAINNDIEIVSNADKVLVYERTISPEGLSWAELQNWWSDIKQLHGDKAKHSLYRRLHGSLPEKSPPQRLLFRTFFERFGQAVVKLPALLPEVWLHWDPKTVAERGPDALLRFRMDFLMLFPNSVRVVIEVDGKHHYSDSTGRASVKKYSNMMVADRDLRLAGYDVYRFGAEELQGSHARLRIIDFFEQLLALHHVPFPRG